MTSGTHQVVSQLSQALLCHVTKMSNVIGHSIAPSIKRKVTSSLFVNGRMYSLRRCLTKDCMLQSDSLFNSKTVESAQPLHIIVTRGRWVWVQDEVGEDAAV